VESERQSRSWRLDHRWQTRKPPLRSIRSTKGFWTESVNAPCFQPGPQAIVLLKRRSNRVRDCCSSDRAVESRSFRVPGDRPSVLVERHLGKTNEFGWTKTRTPGRRPSTWSPAADARRGEMPRCFAAERLDIQAEVRQQANRIECVCHFKRPSGLEPHGVQLYFRPAFVGTLSNRFGLFRHPVLGCHSRRKSHRFVAESTDLEHLNRRYLEDQLSTLLQGVR
jgi:hypothetical protein